MSNLMDWSRKAAHLNVVRGNTISAEDLEDLTQEIALQYLELQARGIRSGRRAWRFHAFEAARKVWGDKRLQKTLNWGESRPSLEDLPEPVFLPPRDEALIARARLSRLWSTLTDVQRAGLSTIFGGSYADLAARLGTSTGSVSNARKRALARLNDPGAKRQYTTRTRRAEAE